MKRKLIVLSAVLFGVLCLGFVAQAAAQEGDLVKGSDRGVYLIKSGKRFAFPSEKAFKSYGYSFDAVKKLPDTELKALQFGGFLFAKDALFKLSNDSKVYMYVNGSLRHLETPASAVKQAGADWGNKIQLVTLSQLSSFTMGTKIAESDAVISTSTVTPGEVVLPSVDPVTTPVTQPQDSPAADTNSVNTPSNSTSQNITEIIGNVQFLKPTGTGKWRFEHQISFAQSTNCSDSKSWLDPAVGSTDASYQEGWESGFLAGQDRREYVEAKLLPVKVYDDTVASSCTGQCATGYKNGYRKGYDYYTASVQSFYKRCMQPLNTSVFDTDGWRKYSAADIAEEYTKQGKSGKTLSYGFATPMLLSSSKSGDTQAFMGVLLYDANKDTSRSGAGEGDFYTKVLDGELNKNYYNGDNAETNIDFVYFHDLTGGTMTQGADAMLSAAKAVPGTSVVLKDCTVSETRETVAGVKYDNIHQTTVLLCPKYVNSTTGKAGYSFLYNDYYWMQSGSKVAFVEIVRSKQSFEKEYNVADITASGFSWFTADELATMTPNDEFMTQLLNKVTF